MFKRAVIPIMGVAAFFYSRRKKNMSKRLFNLIFGIVSGVEASGEAIVAYIKPEYAVQIAAAIPIISNAIIAVCKLFVKDE